MVETPKRPIPGRIWLILAVMIVGAVACFALAVLMGTRLRAMGPERSGAREGYMQVVKPATRGEMPPSSPEADAQLAALLEGAPVPVAEGAAPTEGASSTLPAGEVSGPTVTGGVPLDMPLAEMLPTETPPAPKAPAVPPLPPKSNVSPLDVQAAPDQPVWKANAVTVPVTPGAPMLAIILDDMGGQMEASRRAVDEMPAGVTLSFFPWSRPGIGLAEEARVKGHEIMVHMPMEALPHGNLILDPGPDTLRVGMAPDQIDTLLTRNLARLSSVAVGLNNHMGSRFTGWEEGMRAVLTVAQREGMMFVDSKTAAPTATATAAGGLTLPVLTRDVFLDHVPTAQAVKAELNKAVLLARKRGSAIAIGHPLPVTLDVLRDMLPQVVSSGVVLVPVTMLVKDR
ncbi:MAG: hypothetical protein DI585_03760 [Pseudomonas fluorescens]|nr:MAG: hypothetical protein DI585_03760 [Pseudomonas fluorescens]